MKKVAFAALMGVASVSVQAQQAPVGPTAAVVASPATPIATLQPATGDSVLRVGTPVPLRLTEELTTKDKKLRVGQRFNMEVAEAVIVNGTTVIPVGVPAVGEIMEVRNKGMWGKSGHFGARIVYLTVNGRQVRLSGAFDDKGTAGGVGAAAVSAIVFLPAGFFMTGTSARLPAGSAVKGFIDEDVPFAVSQATVAPMTISAPVIAPVAPAPVASGTPVIKK